MCQAKVSPKCTGNEDTRLSDGSRACEECERALVRENHRMNVGRRRADPPPVIAALPRTTPFGRFE